MCLRLVPVFQGSFFAAAINSTNEANKAGNTGRYAVYIAQISLRIRLKLRLRLRHIYSTDIIYDDWRMTIVLHL